MSEDMMFGQDDVVEKNPEDVGRDVEGGQGKMHEGAERGKIGRKMPMTTVRMKMEMMMTMMMAHVDGDVVVMPVVPTTNIAATMRMMMIMMMGNVY